MSLQCVLKILCICLSFCVHHHILSRGVLTADRRTSYYLSADGGAEQDVQKQWSRHDVVSSTALHSSALRPQVSTHLKEHERLKCGIHRTKVPLLLGSLRDGRARGGYTFGEVDSSLPSQIKPFGYIGLPSVLPRLRTVLRTAICRSNI